MVRTEAAPAGRNDPGGNAGDDPGGNAGDNQGDPGAGGMERFAADIATAAWRLRARAASLPPEMRSLTRHIESLWDLLAQAGVDVRDHVDTPFDPGLALTVVAYQPTAGIDREQVVEAIRPSVYLRDRLIQKAEVIVGTPAEPGVPEPANAPTEENEQAHG
jgi:hypothetical protein